ncbi:MAG: D-2-hydroxyacid dehydrogenase [Gammaproteobacteria bacterium]|nr:D-2-hydroxyacid dehydrogenase [Gammaproteobacteria bacterium]
MKILVIPGLTLSPLTETHRAQILEACPQAEIVVATGQEAAKHAEEAEVIFGLIDRHMFEKCKKLKWVHATASGIDMFLFPGFVDSQVLLTSEKGLVGSHLADHAFSLLLMLTRQTAHAHSMGSAAWSNRARLRARQFELTGLTMGCFGFGGTGREIAKRAVAFGMKAIALDCDPVCPSREVESVMISNQFADFLKRSDVVAVCCPLTSETRGKFDSFAFSKMKNSSILVNVTRGEIVDLGSLVIALREGEIAGAALDVVSGEPLDADNALWQFENVVMSPHTAGASQFRSERNLRRFCTNLKRFIAGDELEGLIDKKRGY